MTNDNLEAVFKANVGTSFQTALHAVFTQGWFAGAGSTPNSSMNKVATTAKPTVIVKLAHVGA